MPAGPSTFYVTGGTLSLDAPSYVERAADRELLESLRRGEYCHVLTSRQMGKSSLMVRAAQALRSTGHRVAVIDLTAFGQNVTPEQWYDGLTMRVGRQLRVEDAVEAMWESRERLAPCHRFFSVLHDVVGMDGADGDLVVFVDELDMVRSLPFRTDEFFAAIRECYNRRTESVLLGRLTFCLLGVATPSDLVRDSRITPFNIGRKIELTDFRLEEAGSLAEGFRSLGGSGAGQVDGAELLARIVHWTNGHPYLTQRLCRAVVEWLRAGPEPGVRKGATVRGGRARRLVDELCRGLFLDPRARELDDNLVFVRERLLRSEVGAVEMLECYRRVRWWGAMRDDPTDPRCAALKLAGIVWPRRGRLKTRNRVYRRVFNRRWIEEHMPETEARRRLVAFRVGVLGTILVVLGVVWVGNQPLVPTITAGGSVEQSGVSVVELVEGRVEVKRRGSPAWDPAYDGQKLFLGDELRCLPGSRATLENEDGVRYRIHGGGRGGQVLTMRASRITVFEWVGERVKEFLVGEKFVGGG